MEQFLLGKAATAFGALDDAANKANSNLEEYNCDHQVAPRPRPSGLRPGGARSAIKQPIPGDGQHAVHKEPRAARHHF